MEEVNVLIEMVKGKYADELDIPESEVEKIIWQSLKKTLD